MDVLQHVQAVREKIAAAARASGRSSQEITLCAATKVQTDETIRAVIAAGVTVCGEKVELTIREFTLLQTLLEHKNIVMSRDTLIDQVWGYDYYVETNIVDVYIRYLRHKIADRFQIHLISTVRGIGYVIKED